MAELKTKVNEASVEDFLNRVENEQKRQDSFAILEMMKELTGKAPKMWGESIVGFGSYHYKYATGREGDMPLVAFSPRKQNLTLYIMSGFDNYERLLTQLGKHSTGSACLYIKKLKDVDLEVLRQMVKQSYEHMKSTNSPLVS